MLEVKYAGDADYHVCALIDPNVTSYGYALVPPETKVTFRLRAFYYGPPSNVEHQTTKVPNTEKGKTEAPAKPNPAGASNG
jgi:hypothetical protein